MENLIRNDKGERYEILALFLSKTIHLNHLYKLHYTLKKAKFAFGIFIRQYTNKKFVSNNLFDSMQQEMRSHQANLTLQIVIFILVR